MALTALASNGHPATARGQRAFIEDGALKIMTWTKAKTAIVIGVGVLFAAGTAITVKEIREHTTYPWQVAGFNGQRLNQAPPQIAILPSKVSSESIGNTAAGKMMGTGASAQSVIETAYGLLGSTRTVFLTELPKGRFDFIASLPSGNEEALQQEVKRKFCVVAKVETRETDVLLLKVNHSGASGLKQGTVKYASVDDAPGRLSCVGCTFDSFAANLEPILNVPVFNQTKLAGNFDINVKWDATGWQHRNPEGLKQALIDQLGLELVPSREPVEILVVEKVN